MSDTPAGKLCALCGRHSVEPAYRPFCSRRCADVDLSRWFSGRYAVAAEEAESQSSDPSPEGDG